MIISKIYDNMEKVEKYLNSLLNENIHLSKATDINPNKIPAYIKLDYDFYNATIYDISVCLLSVKRKPAIENTPLQLYNIMLSVKNILNQTVVFVFDSIASYNKQRLINYKVNFIIPGNQLFIPELLLSLNNRNSSVDCLYNNIKPQKLSNIAQLILLYHLQKYNLDGSDCQGLMYKLHSSYITTMRAIDSLKNASLIQISNTKVKRIAFTANGKDLWNRAFKYLSSPVKHVLHTDAFFSDIYYCKSNISALSYFTMINEDVNKQYAISDLAFKKLRSKMKIKLDQNYGDNIIEVWKYDPALLSDNNCVDRLSLYLSFRDNKEPRIEKETEKLLNQVW
jgi:hypothetical protein